MTRRLSFSNVRVQRAVLGAERGDGSAACVSVAAGAVERLLCATLRRDGSACSIHSIVWADLYYVRHQHSVAVFYTNLSFYAVSV